MSKKISISTRFSKKTATTVILLKNSDWYIDFRKFLKNLDKKLNFSKIAILVKTYEKRGKSEGFDSCDRPSNLTQIGFESLKFDGWPEKTIGHLFYAT